MEQVPQARVPVQAGVRAAERAGAEAGWAGLMPQDRAEIASVRVAEPRSLIQRGSPAIKEAVPNVVRK